MASDRDPAVVTAFAAGSVLAGGNAVAVRSATGSWTSVGRGLPVRAGGAGPPGPHAGPPPGDAPRPEPPRPGPLRRVQLRRRFAFAYYGLLRVHAGFGQTLLALVPLLTLLLAVLHRKERLRADALIGGTLALVGVGLMEGFSVQDAPLASVVAIVGSALCFAEAAVLIRVFPPVHPVVTNAVGMVAGALLLVAGALVAGDAIVLPERAATWAAVVFLALVGSVFVFLLYVFVLRRWDASRAAYTFVIIPFVAVLPSAWLDDEPIGLGLVGGGLLVLAGVYVGALRPSAARAHEESAGAV